MDRYRIKEKVVALNAEIKHEYKEMEKVSAPYTERINSKIRDIFELQELCDHEFILEQDKYWKSRFRFRCMICGVGYDVDHAKRLGFKLKGEE